MSLQAMTLFCAAVPCVDPLFYLSHRHYLSRMLSTRQCIAAALDHYRRESRQFNAIGLAAVSRGRGPVLWQEERAAVSYRMQLRADPRLPREGAVSVRRPADEVVLCEISFSWISAQVFGRAPPGFDASAPLVPFITRNQSVHGSHPSLREFETQFPHHSPKYLCLAALHRVCGTQGVSWVAGIRHECQIAFDPVHGESFNYSCTRLWLSPGGVPLGPHALAMRSPLALPPLSQVGAKHRKRAEARRWLRGRINTAAEKVVRQHLQAG